MWCAPVGLAGGGSRWVIGRARWRPPKSLLNHQPVSWTNGVGMGMLDTFDGEGP